MKNISVIIPHYGHYNNFQKNCLPFLNENKFTEIVFVDANDADLAINRPIIENGIVLQSGKGRGRQLAVGADSATRSWLLFLHSDTRLIGPWREAMEAHIAAHSEKAAVFELTYDEPGYAPWFVGRWGTMRTRFFGVPYGDQGLLISRKLYDEAGGYCRDMPLMEDVDIINRLGRKRVRMIAGSTLTSSEKYLKDGWFSRGLRHWYYYTSYRLGRTPDILYDRYYHD